MSERPIYLDYNATTPIDPAVMEAMRPYLEEEFGNPSSSHAYGRAAHEAVERARAQVAALIGAAPDEIVFTGGGSEANNLAIKGVVWRALFGDSSRFAPSPHLGRLTPSPLVGQGRGGGEDACEGIAAHSLREANRSPMPADKVLPPHLVTSVVEHPAVLQPCRFLEKMGCRLTVLPVDQYGRVDPQAVRDALRRQENTRLMSIMHANNEVGTIEPIAVIARICREHGALLHTDAAQSLGKICVSVDELGVDLLSIAGHKLYAPKGVGALYVRRGVALEPLIHGAAHESGRRAGTENVPYIVALGKACEIAAANLQEQSGRLQGLRDRLWHRLRERLREELVLNGHPQMRLPNTLNVNFPGVSGQELLEAVPGVAASTGSACHSGQVSLSPVLKAMGVPPELGLGAVRLSVGRFTTPEEVERAAELLAVAWETCCRYAPSSSGRTCT